MKRHVYLLIVTMALLSACGIYKFTDTAAINPDWKTVKISYIDNRASYVNPQLSQKFNDKLQQKITSSTKLTRTNNDDASLVISGTIVNYDATQTVGINSTQATVNRLTVTMRMNVKYNVGAAEPKDFTVTRSFDYSANLSLQQAEGRLLDEVVRTMTDEIFNQIFSNW